MKTVAVYGSSRITAAEPEYAQAREVGQALAEAGFAVMTGGYNGIMEAISQGAAAAGGHVIGITTEAIESMRTIKANQWVNEEIKHVLFSDRLAYLVKYADGYVTMPGGIGTLHELVSVWELMRLGEIPHRPLICYGPFWQEMLERMLNHEYVHPDYQQYLHFSNTPQDVVTYLQAFRPKE
ncbi:MAG: TIGR00730 family Rossman fold protein [Anaerolineae bacterium]|nr:TIGR00730 family Rossman fold protein [Anaerolineae bacterium]